MQSRAPSILAVLVVVALVLAGAWRIGRPAEDAGLEPEVTPLAAEVEHAAAPELVLEPLADPNDPDAAEPESAERVAIVAPESASPGASAAAANGARADARFVRGTLVDALTDEPLPGYRFELRDATRESNLIVTDEQGAFTSTERLMPGPLVATFFEARAEPVDVGELALRDDGEARPLALRVESGPTLRIELSPADAPPLGDHAVWLAREDFRRLVGRPVAGQPDAVRFAALPPTLTYSGEARLEVQSRDGAWVGGTTVPLVPGRQARTIAVRLEARAALEVRVVDDAGAPLENAFVTWTEQPDGKPREATTRKDGLAVFPRMSPSAGTLVVRLVRWREVALPLLLAPGVRRVETIALARVPSAGAIAGKVLSDSTRYERDVRIRLVPLDAGRGTRALNERVRWSLVGGARVGAFEFPELPAGRFRLEIAENDFYAWEPRTLTLEAPRGDVLLVVGDAIPVCDLAFEPREEDGTPFAGPFEVRIVGAGETRVFSGRDGALVVPQFPVDAPIRWRIDAAGRAAEFGAWPALAPLPSVDGRERRGASPVLARGWAQMYRVVRSDDRKPIAGAIALVDGQEAGRTNAQGRIELRAATRPGKVVFRSKDWRMIDRVDLSPLRNGSNEFERTIRLEPPKKKAKK